ncbi:MAG TPA: MATE family efflux transporter [Candidatus Dependentiae bacterium]|nr:MATE family efflux transporter [Candidatus Dependentiae bacterium]
MKKNLIRSFIDGINDIQTGERYSTILRYFGPEFITNLLLYSLPFFIDAYFIGRLSTAAYATVGVTNTLLHWFVKFAEAFSVATVILTGQLNGSDDREGAGKVLATSFWISCFVGIAISTLLYFGAPIIYSVYGVPDNIAVLGINYLRFRAIGLFLMFVYQACVGFLRGVKNTRIPMISFVIGTMMFIISDYLLIFGCPHCPALGLEGSALASIIQYATATVVVVLYLIAGPYAKSYAIDLFGHFRDLRFIKNILSLSWPIILDKAVIPLAYIWLIRILNPMGTNVIAAFCVVRNMEQCAFLPAIACAQVITFLVSNDIGAGNWHGVKSNIKKVLFAALCMMFAILIIFTLFPRPIVQLFDRQNDFTAFAVHVFPVISIFMFFDLFQVILAGALRGAANVKVVMLTRVIVLLGYFIPVSYFLSTLVLPDDIKFILIYSSFYLGNAIMSGFYIYHFRSDRWKKYAGVSDD